MTRETFVVICRDDFTPGADQKGPYLLASRQVFASAEDARDYARGISPSREPLVIVGDWLNLRWKGEWKA